MTQVTVLHPQASSSSIQSEIDAFGRSVIDSVVNRKGLSFSIAVSDESDIGSISGHLEKFLLLLSAASGGTLARVAPRFSDDTLPALASLTRELPAGWKAEGERTIRYGRARQVFVSVDRPFQSSGAERGYYTSESVGIRPFRCVYSFENHPRSITLARIEMFTGHIFQCLISLSLGFKPVESFPICFEQVQKCIARGEAYTDTIRFCASRLLINVVGVANFHGEILSSQNS